MDPRLLRYYNRELQFIREMGGEFASEYPKIAGRLGLEQFECADPYVERLLEGFAFLAARVQLKLDAEFPRFAQHLLEMIFPQYLAPVPSMAVVQFNPELSEAGLARGVRVPKHTVLHGLLGKGEQTSCEYRTAQETTLWPVELVEAAYYTRDLASLDIGEAAGAKAAIRLRLRATAGLKFNALALDRLPIYLRGSEELPMRIYEQLLGNCQALVARPAKLPAAWRETLPAESVGRRGFGDEESLLPGVPRAFSGYRLLREYFAFPERFLFVELTGLAPVMKRAAESEIDLVFLLKRIDPALENAIDASHFALYSTAAINLFPKRADRIHLSNREWEHHIVPDRARPMDFEVYDVTQVTGYGSESDSERSFQPFYAANDLAGGGGGDGAYYALRRTPRLLSSKQKVDGPRSSYIGTEVFLSLVDAREAPYSADLKQLGIGALCSNRDLPLMMPVGHEKSDFSMEQSLPVRGVRCVSGPTKPRPSFVEGEVAWRLVSHLSLNYLTLSDTDDKQGASALRELLSLYIDPEDAQARMQVDGVKSLKSDWITRRLQAPGPIAFGRGLELALTFEERAFTGTGIFLLGAVLEQFFARAVSMNSFTETVVKSDNRGEVMRWPARPGQKALV